MLKKLISVIFAITLIVLVGCGEQKKAPEPSLLQEISGVWKAKGGLGLMTLEYADNKLQMLMDDTFIAVTVGAIDDVNRTVNFNVTLRATGKPAVWTVRQIWNTDKSSFHLQLTLNDGTQEDFSFVRTISTDDLNHIASIQTEPKQEKAAVAATETVAQPAQPDQQQAQALPVAASAVPPVIEPAPSVATSAPAQPAPAKQASEAFAPSFDCAKVSSGPERLICDTPRLAELDVLLTEAYQHQMELTDNKRQLKADQIKWRKKERDACSTAECIELAYTGRIQDLEAVSGYMAKPAEFK